MIFQMSLLALQSHARDGQGGVIKQNSIYNKVIISGDVVSKEVSVSTVRYNRGGCVPLMRRHRVRKG